MENGTRKIEYLSRISSPEDLKAIPREELAALAEEIRSELVRVVSDNGGHLASNLGVVELTMAIHRVFDCPRDHLIFDVGHQSYVHKMLTGRYDRIDSIRRAGGISGFPKRSESEYDCFGAGHSSTSISSALGFATADGLSGSDAYTVAVVGDGAFTGGMIHEALNNCKKDLKLVIILNENEMSISKNIGRFATSLSKIRTSAGYFKTKRATGIFLRKIPFVGNALFEGVKKLKMMLKNALYGSNYFESMGLT
ncbi:MAG: 1-deoxy-D-xylulose-5-phosphate synthase, partial [Clostridia bacterium]|nr:1-deoxy-D-xylulose-5-phosphate synthase [Clostridia bacterium]